MQIRSSALNLVALWAMATYSESSTPCWTALLIAFPPALPFFTKYSVELHGGELSFGFRSCCRKTVPVGDIQSVDAESVDALTQWGGWGIRGVRGVTGYIARSGSALRITVRSEGGQAASTFVFTCADPAALMQKLRGGESSVARGAGAL